MNQAKLNLKAARDYLKLAQVYHRIANYRGKLSEFWRGAVDANYNAAELCVKGLLKLKDIDIPSTHNGVVMKFGLHYVKSGQAEKELGRTLNRSLKWRNLARYEVEVEVIEDNIAEVNKLTKTLIRMLTSKIKKL